MFLIRFFLHWAIDAGAIALVARYLPGVHAADMRTIVLAGLALALVNMFIRPILRVLTFPITLLSFGLFSLVLNALLLMLVALLVPTFAIDGFWHAVVAALAIAIISSLAERVLMVRN